MQGQADLQLPPLREELTIVPAAADHDGQPGWILHDPLRNQFFQQGWAAFEVLSRWHLRSAAAILDSIRHETTLRLKSGDIDAMLSFLVRGHLLQSHGGGDVRRLLADHDAARPHWLTWLLHHYLFFRLPLVRPDPWLDRWLPSLRWLGGRRFRLATLAALAMGLVLVGRQWSVFQATLIDHLSLPGLAAFGIALGAAKIVHELGHAFTAKAQGVRVPTMGVAFLVMMPVLYTDVSEAWTLPGRRQRLWIGGAGMLAELTLAVWATLAWALLPDGWLRTMAFVLAATTWISSLAVNLSPFMRFDGYFLLMDGLNLPNLHGRSFALARWHLRESLFSLGEPAPERLPSRLQGGLILFAWLVWIYRLVLFLGIAALVYHFFIKVVGVVLFAVEMGWFIARPIWLEIREWGMRRPVLLRSWRGKVSLALLLVLLALCVTPWSGRITAPGMLHARDHVRLYTPTPAVLRDILVQPGQTVTAGQELAHLDNPDLTFRQQQVQQRLTVLRYELSMIGFEGGFRDRAQSLSRQLDAAIAEQAALARDAARLTLTAPMDGVVVDISPVLQVGQWINPKDAVLAVVAGGMIDAYALEEDVHRLDAGDQALFVPEGSSQSYPARVAEIDRAAIRLLPEPALAAPYGGSLAARNDSKGLIPDRALYHLRLDVTGYPPGRSLRGEVLITGRRQSLLGGAMRSAAAVLLREWGM